MGEIRREPIPIVVVCSAGPAILPLLRAELARPDSPRRLTVARALAWYGDRSATDALLEEITRQLASAPGEVPRRTVHIRYSLAAPDHGNMPALAFLLHSLAMERDERAIEVLMPIAEALNPTLERFTDHHSGLFYYVDAVCDIAERLGHPACVPALQRIHQYSLFHNRVNTLQVQPDYVEERLAYLELTVSRAMARCGDHASLEILIGYLSDSRRMLARHSHRELCSIAGLDLPAEPATWRAWAAGVTTLTPRPWLKAYDPVDL